MEQHPIPQQISSYQFKLVGDMTLKQFFQVAGGVVVGLLFYASPLHPLIKWPLILFSTLLGVGLAFLPFEERPLEKWIIAFFRSIYSPTLYSWKKTTKPDVFFTENALVPEIKSNVATNTTSDLPTAKLETGESSYLTKISSLWKSNGKNYVNTVPSTGDQLVSQPITPPTPSNTQVPNVVAPPLPSFAPTVNKAVVNPATTSVSQPGPNIVSIPQQVPTIITKSAPKLVVEETTHQNGDNQHVATEIETQKVEEKPITSENVEFSIDAAPPSPSIVINTIVGQIMDQDRKIIEGAIMEIKDLNGRPVRALKSNKAGHFIIVTPLVNGKYEVTIEKDGYEFKPLSFEAKGEIIPPIAIRGTKT